ncbi:hypothetical protein D3C87_1872930 [compost metagenome]
MISVRMMNIMRFSVWTAANQLRFCLDQSRRYSSPLIVPASSWATWGACCMSDSLSRTPVGPDWRNSVSASLMSIRARALSNS